MPDTALVSDTTNPALAEGHAYFMMEASRPATTLRLQIHGRLTDTYRLARSIIVVLEQDEDEVIVSEELFDIHGSGATRSEALAAFRRIFGGYLDILTDREETLGEHLKNQLGYLRTVITRA